MLWRDMRERSRAAASAAAGGGQAEARRRRPVAPCNCAPNSSPRICRSGCAALRPARQRAAAGRSRPATPSAPRRAPRGTPNARCWWPAQGFRWDELVHGRRQPLAVRRRQAGRSAHSLRQAGPRRRRGLAALLRPAARRRRHAGHPAGTRLDDQEGGLVRHARRSRRRRRMQRPVARSTAGLDRRAPGAPATRTRRARRSTSSPPTSKATCSPPTRKSRNSACSTRPAKSPWPTIEAAVLNVARYDVDELRDGARWPATSPAAPDARRPQGRRRRDAAGALGLAAKRARWLR